MANEKNLIPNSARTPEELRIMAINGGKRSGEVRRKKKTMKQCMEMLLALPANTKADHALLTELGLDLSLLTKEEVNNVLVVNATLLKNAKEGDVSSIRELRDIVEDNAYQAHKIKIDNAKLELEKQKLKQTPVSSDAYRGIQANLVAPSFASVLFDIEQYEHNEYVLMGGRGSTKSSFISLAIVDLIMKHESMHACVLRNVGNTLKDSVYAQMQWAITALGLEGDFTYTKSPLEITRIKTGQKVFFRGADDPNKIKSIKAPFGYIGIVWFEELDQFKGDEAVRKIEQSVIRGGDVAYKFKSFNPPKSALNWANKYIKIPREDRLVVESTYLDVPKKWLGETFLRDAEFLKETNQTAYENEYLGIANGTGGNVFDNVHANAISDEEIAEFDRIYNGIDWGWYPDPWAFNRCYFDKARLTLYIYAEAHENKFSNSDSADMLIKQFGITANDKIICDSAEPKSISDYKAYGLLARPAQKGPGSVDYSMKWLQSLNKIIIDNRRCPHTAEEFFNYEYERDKEGHVISGYPDKGNHHIDAVRYAMNDVWKKRGQ